MSNREMVHEHIWTDGDEEFKAEPDSGVWYREGEKWLRAHNDWASRYVREELLRVVKERDELEKKLATEKGIVQAQAVKDLGENRMVEELANALELCHAVINAVNKANPPGIRLPGFGGALSAVLAADKVLKRVGRS